ncbi:MAG: hypothetical protein IT386_07430 [Deltaproteobacteria bacterium]|nr:hypothetical protein [Deltaproteobacteria bacterium]
MRCFEVFATMPREQAREVLRTIREKAPAGFQQALLLACGVMRSRPVYMRGLPFEKQADAVRSALARVASNQVAEEMLAVYFLECRRPLLIEWLDAIGLAHDNGVLADERPPQPDEAKLAEVSQSFLAGEEPEIRRLLLRAFSAQEPIEWPALDALVAPHASA